MPVAVEIRPNDDGTVDVIAAGLTKAAGLALAGQIIDQAGRGPSTRSTPANVIDKAGLTAKGRRKAPQWTCPRCGQVIFVQGRISHERRHEREDAAAAAKGK